MDRRSVLTYLTLGCSGVIAYKAGQGLISATQPTADVQRFARPITVETKEVPPGTFRVYRVNSAPLLVWHRSKEETERAKSQDLPLEWPDRQARISGITENMPARDFVLTAKHEWLVIWCVCPNLGCIPIAQKGDFGGFFCPCDKSHYDLAGRFRTGPKPRNMEVIRASLSKDARRLTIPNHEPPIYWG